MYSNAKIPEPFCRRAGGSPSPTPAAAREQEGRQSPAASNARDLSETLSASEKKQPAGNSQDTMPLLAFLLMEFFH